MTFRFLIALSFAAILTLSSSLAAISINAKSAILLDANSGQVLYKKNDTAQRAVASTQKLLTALLIAEAG
ncbi:MAG: D-alanyl-D-alanine carboxypeptidase, partial [Verrucomicrobiota bacterium]